ncbi:ScyD/ScyE family protein [Granulicella sp. L60]|uniref:ScyD/ScyE family protein n=1 Tax=Granulicella sp. L60 TaxID=1641866 RepID=UPI00131BF8C6|nr:ScyD/ScyE family protein [Granulicella sp. L60]
MKRTTFAVPFLCAAVVVGGVSGVRMLAQMPANATVYASGLEDPRGLAFGPDGSLYVAEAGLGGKNSTVGTCEQVPPPIGPYKGGPTARISKIDTKGDRTTLVSGLPSAVDSQGDVLGVADLAFLNGGLYASLAGGGCSHGNPSFPNSILKVDTKSGKWTSVANMSNALVEFPAKYESAGDFEPDGSWYGMIASNGQLLTVEPNHGQVFSVTTGGKVSQAIDVSASQGHIVPTSLVEEQGVLYVGNLNLFPINPQWAKVMTVAKGVLISNPLPGFAGPIDSFFNWNIVSSKAGFTTVVSLKVGRDGLLYVLELSAAAGYPTPGDGKVVRVTRSGDIEDVVTGLSVPTGMAFGPDGALYISNLGAAPQGTPGQIWRVEVPAVQ